MSNVVTMAGFRGAKFRETNKEVIYIIKVINYSVLDQTLTDGGGGKLLDLDIF